MQEIYDAQIDGVFGRQIYVAVSIADRHACRFNKPDQLLRVVRFAPDEVGNYHSTDATTMWLSAMGPHLGAVRPDLYVTTNTILTRSDVIN